MVWASAEAGVFDLSLEDMAERLGVDNADARDVVGAVYAFCRERHGTSDLSSGYLSFLVAKVAYAGQGRQLTADEAALFSRSDCHDDRFLLRALACADDAASLYEAYRRDLVRAVLSNLSPGGHVLRLKVNRIAVDRQQYLSMTWLSASRRLARWIIAWRAGSAELDTVVVRCRGRHPTSNPESRAILEDALRFEEQTLGLAAARIVWATE